MKYPYCNYHGRGDDVTTIIGKLLFPKAFIFLGHLVDSQKHIVTGRPQKLFYGDATSAERE